jgi:DNA-binding MarR family transcriptional regulator
MRKDFTSIWNEMQIENFRPGLLFETFVVSQLARDLLGEAIRDGGLTTVEYGVQSAIGTLDGITPAELATLTGMPPSSLSRHIARLTELGHLQREPHPTDGRAYRLRLTPNGREVYLQNGAGLKRLLARIDEHLDTAAADVLAAMQTLERALRAIRAEDAAPAAE